MLHLDKLQRTAYQVSIARGAPCLYPIKGKIHWCEFTAGFGMTGKGPRLNPETDLPEGEEPNVA
jgi:hypothetical protein